MRWEDAARAAEGDGRGVDVDRAARRGRGREVEPASAVEVLGHAVRTLEAAAKVGSRGPIAGLGRAGEALEALLGDIVGRGREVEARMAFRRGAAREEEHRQHRARHPPCSVRPISIACSAPDCGTISPARSVISAQCAATPSGDSSSPSSATPGVSVT